LAPFYGRTIIAVGFVILKIVSSANLILKLPSFERGENYGVMDCEYLLYEFIVVYSSTGNF
jgi:hypothetical protein